MTEHVYPDEPAGPFPTPPAAFEDADGRTIEVTTFDGPVEPLATMYDEFDPGDRAQGLPPVRPEAIRDWVEMVLANGINLVAWDEDAIVGHTTIVPGDGDEYELAIFVLGSHREAGIGRALVEHLLGLAADRGIKRVWLTVERWNDPARHLYRSVGFETTDTSSFEIEMRLRLDDASVEEA